MNRANGADRKRSWIPVAAVALAALSWLATAPAHADTIVQEQSFNFDLVMSSPGMDGATEGLSFDLFDPSLGTLTGVELTLDSEADVTAFVRVVQGIGSSVDGSSSVSGLLTQEWTFLTTDQAFGPVTAACSGSDGCFGSAFMSVDFDSSFSETDPAPLLATFTGLGSVSGTLGIDATFSVQSSPGATAIGFGDVTWSGLVSLTYLYEPFATEVPQPGGLLLLGTGLAALGLVLWRQSVAVAPRRRLSRRPR